MDTRGPQLIHTVAMRHAFTFLLVGLCACGSGGSDAVRVRMDFSRPQFYEAPFPSDDRLAADGTIDLSGYPNPDDNATVASLLGLLDRRARGFGTTSTIYMPVTGAIDPASLPTLEGSVSDDASVFLVDVDEGSPEFLERRPVSVVFQADGGPFGPTGGTIALLPVQGMPLLPDTLYAAVVTTRVTDERGGPLAATDLDLEGSDIASLAKAASVLSTHDVDLGAVAGLTAFTTQDPISELAQFVEHARTNQPPALDTSFSLVETYDDYCVYQSTIDMPSYQQGEPPFRTTGGGWPETPEVQVTETSRIFVTVPRAQVPDGGWPTVVMVRTGGGGDRPLIDRGVRDADGVAAPGSGPATQLAQVGFAGVMVDGPLGGLRNVTNGDEQFLIFNVNNLSAMRDNIRQSALELALLPDVLGSLSFPIDDCADASNGPMTVDGDHLALMGHSMGATIAPLVLANSDDYRAAILSGAGGSWIHNIMYKLKPVELNPVAVLLLGYQGYHRRLSEHDAALMLFQWAIEAADPPPYARARRARAPLDVLMIQGIVDHYILPPIANSTSLSLGLDLAGDELDTDNPELAELPTFSDRKNLAGLDVIELPASGNREDGAVTGVVVQHPEDGIEDGHEVMFQLAAPKAQYSEFLRSWVADGVPTVPAPSALARDSRLGPGHKKQRPRPR